MQLKSRGNKPACSKVYILSVFNLLICIVSKINLRSIDKATS